MATRGGKPQETQRPPAGPWIRLGARAIDVVSIFLFMLVPGQVINLIFPGWLGGFTYNQVAAGLAVIDVVFYLGYFAIRETSSGQTLGKLTLGLKVVGPDGGNPTLGESLRRNIFGAAPLLILVPGMGSGGSSLVGALLAASVGLTIGLDRPRRQGWHDKFADGTQVVRVPRLSARPN